MQNAWQNRITGYAEKAAKEFKLNPLNPKTHPQIQQKAVAAILAEVGWVTGVIENQRSGFIVDGESRILEALKNNPDEIIPFTKVDLSEEEERKILALFDYIGSLAITDVEKFHELLENIDFESEVLEQLAAGLQDETLDLEEFFHQETIETPAEKFSILLEFEEKDEYQKFSDALEEIAGTPKDAIRTLLKL